MIVIKIPSFISDDDDTKSDSIYSITPLIVKRNGRNILKASLMGKILLTNVSNAVTRITPLETMTTISEHPTRNASTKMLAINRILPMDKLSDFISLMG
jgi:hypothetical protein